MKRRFLTAAAAGMMSTAMIMNAFAAPGTVSEGGAIPYSDGTEVWAGVMLDDPDAKIRVYVPTLFAFVVNGSVTDDGYGIAISEENGNLMLPNMKVAVDTEDGNETDHNYSIQTVGEGHMYFENCSTAISEDDASVRVGIPVSIKGSIKNEGTLESRNYWEHVGEAPTEDDFKKYRLNVGEIPFDTAEDGGFSMGQGIELDAPDLGYDVNSKTYNNLDKDNYAITGAQKDVRFGVEVGGMQKDYKQVEESAKVGTIVWTISYDIENEDGIHTAPDHAYQDQAGTIADPGEEHN